MFLIRKIAVYHQSLNWGEMLSGSGPPLVTILLLTNYQLLVL